MSDPYNTEYMRQFRENNRKQYNAYMAGYMRKRRARLKAEGKPGYDVERQKAYMAQYYLDHKEEILAKRRNRRSKQ